MSVAVSSWRLAQAVARTGQLGVVSGTALDAVVARRLQDGDPGGHLRRALRDFPLPEVAERVLHRYYRPRGRGGRPYQPIPRLSLRYSRAGTELALVGNFAEVWLAKEGHSGLIGINYLEKIQMAIPAFAYGAMLAGVDFVLIGTGVPVQIPRLLTDLARHAPGVVQVDVADGAPHPVTLHPARYGADRLPPLRRPAFLAIVSSHRVAQQLAGQERTRPDGFVVQGPRAGGHNAPPSERPGGEVGGEAVGQPQPEPEPRDVADLAAMTGIGLPFWLSGGYGEPEKVRTALAAGAAGVQVGTLFALSRESGLAEGLREHLLQELRSGTLLVRTDRAASPLGLPFKVAALEGTLAEEEVYTERSRRCDLGYLRQPYARPDGAIGYRCPAEPSENFRRKGGDPALVEGAKCLCNAQLATIGLAQRRRNGYVEPALVTLGADLTGARRLDAEHWLHGGSADGWSAAEAVRWLLREVGTPAERALGAGGRTLPVGP